MEVLIGEQNINRHGSWREGHWIGQFVLGRSRFLELPGGFFNFFQQKFIFFPLNQFASCLLT